MKTISNLGQIDKLFGVPATTHNDFERRILKGQGKKRDAVVAFSAASSSLRLNVAGMCYSGRKRITILEIPTTLDAILHGIPSSPFQIALRYCASEWLLLSFLYSVINRHFKDRG